MLCNIATRKYILKNTWNHSLKFFNSPPVYIGDDGAFTIFLGLENNCFAFPRLGNIVIQR